MSNGDFDVKNSVLQNFPVDLMMSIATSEDGFLNGVRWEQKTVLLVLDDYKAIVFLNPPHVN